MLKNDNGKRPHGYIFELVKSHNNMCPWLTCDHTMNRMRSRVKAASSIRSESIHVSTKGNVVGVNTPPVSPNYDYDEIMVYKKPLGERPVGASHKKRKTDEMALVATINKFALLFGKEKKHAIKGNEKMVRGRLNKIISSITQKITHMLLSNQI